MEVSHRRCDFDRHRRFPGFPQQLHPIRPGERSETATCSHCIIRATLWLTESEPRSDIPSSSALRSAVKIPEDKGRRSPNTPSYSKVHENSRQTSGHRVPSFQGGPTKLSCGGNFVSERRRGPTAATIARNLRRNDLQAGILIAAAEERQKNYLAAPQTISINQGLRSASIRAIQDAPLGY